MNFILTFSPFLMMTNIFELDFYLKYSDMNYQAPPQFDIYIYIYIYIFRVYDMYKYLVFYQKAPP